MTRTTKFLAILTVLTLLTVFYGCVGNGEETEGRTVNEPLEPAEPKQATFPELGWETELQIKKDYLTSFSIEPSDIMLDRVKIRGYFGNYNNIIALTIEEDFLVHILVPGGVINSTYALGYWFDSYIDVWVEGGYTDDDMKFHYFISLRKALDLGFVTKEDIEIMHYRHSNGDDPMSWNPPKWK